MNVTITAAELLELSLIERLPELYARLGFCPGSRAKEDYDYATFDMPPKTETRVTAVAASRPIKHNPAAEAEAGQ